MYMNENNLKKHIFIDFSSIKQKCKTPSKPDGIILDQFLIELSEANAEESQTSDVDAQVLYSNSEFPNHIFSLNPFNFNEPKRFD